MYSSSDEKKKEPRLWFLIRGWHLDFLGFPQIRKEERPSQTAKSQSVVEIRNARERAIGLNLHWPISAQRGIFDHKVGNQR